MDSQELRKLLEQTDDKLSVFSNKEKLKKYQITIKEFLNLINDSFSDEEKFRLFDFQHFIDVNNIVKGGIIDLILDKNILLQIMNNDKIMEGISKYQVLKFLMKLGDMEKKYFLFEKDFIEKYKIPSFEIKGILLSMNKDVIVEILKDKELIINKLKLSEYEVKEMIINLSNDNVKIETMEIYEFQDYMKAEIIKSLNDKNKIEVLLKDNDIKKHQCIDILRTVDIKNLCAFFKDNREVFNKYKINPYEIIFELNSEQQRDFYKNIENCNLSLNEKREILAILSSDVKKHIDITSIPEEYKAAFNIQRQEYSTRIVIDFEKDPIDYQGLDKLMRISPQEFTEEQRRKIIKICEICPNMEVASEINGLDLISSGEEYKKAEEWINSVINDLKPEYTKAQKIAIIDNAIGKKISYSPDFDTEVFDQINSRALWKIISSGYGVCNGIAKVEQYILNRVGIESEFVNSENHAFLKIKNIELPLANGEIIKGNTILDPTWNLSQHKFGGKPDNFLINYEQARKNDIDKEGKDHECHKNDEMLGDAVINLDEESLRQIFKSVGLADQQGQFPIKRLIEMSKNIDDFYADNPEANIDAQLLMLSQICPEFTTCQNSSMRILTDVLLSNENLKFKRCIVNRVYDKSDKEKTPLIYVFTESEEFGRDFYYADKDIGKFIQLTEIEFTQKFECYEEDLKRSKGIRPWDTQEQTEEIDLSKSSGKLVAEEGEER